MAKSLKQVLEQIDKLQEQAKALRAKEVAEVIARIQVAIRHYSLTPDELFGPTLTAVTQARQNKNPKGRAAAKTAKYSDGTNTWGGMGKRPRWFNEALAAGKTKEDLLIQPTADGAAKSQPRRRSVGKANARQKTPGVPKFHNGEGLTWTGKGKRPAWFVAALDAGKTVDDLLIQ